MEYFDQASGFEFEFIGKDQLRCWHITGSSIDISVHMMEDKSIRAFSDNGDISEASNEKLFYAIHRAYKYWNLI